MNKGQKMKLIYSDEELRHIDSAIPIGLWHKIDTSIHVVNYNEPHRYGKLQNLETEAASRGIDLPKIYDEHIEKIKLKSFEKGRGLTRDAWEQSDWESYEELNTLK